MNTKLRIKAKNNFEKDFTKLIRNAVFQKTLENVRKHREIKIVTRERRRNYLVSQPYKVFYRKFISNRNGKNSNTNKKHIYLSLPILDLSKTVVY